MAAVLAQQKMEELLPKTAARLTPSPADALAAQRRRLRRFRRCRGTRRRWRGTAARQRLSSPLVDRSAARQPATTRGSCRCSSPTCAAGSIARFVSREGRRRRPDMHAPARFLVDRAGHRDGNHAGRGRRRVCDGCIRRTARSIPGLEIADMQQRLRVAVDTLTRRSDDGRRRRVHRRTGRDR